MLEAELGDNGRFGGLGLCEGIGDEFGVAATVWSCCFRQDVISSTPPWLQEALPLFICWSLSLSLSLSLLSFICGFCPQALFDESYLDFFPRIWIFLLLRTNYICILWITTLVCTFHFFLVPPRIHLGCHFLTDPFDERGTPSPSDFLFLYQSMSLPSSLKRNCSNCCCSVFFLQNMYGLFTGMMTSLSSCIFHKMLLAALDTNPHFLRPITSVFQQWYEQSESICNLKKKMDGGNINLKWKPNRWNWITLSLRTLLLSEKVREM